MRRIIATSLLLLFAVGLIAPAAVASITTPTPACCRVGGRHHCAAAAVEGIRLEAQACRYRKPLVFSTPTVVPGATRPATPAEAHPFLYEFYPELFSSPAEHPASETSSK